MICKLAALLLRRSSHPSLRRHCLAAMSSSAALPLTAPCDLIAAPTTPVEQAKRLAARTAVDEYVRSGMAIGVGSGSTIVYGIQRLAERVHGAEQLVVRCVPTSFQSRQVRRARRLSPSRLHPGRRAAAPHPCSRARAPLPPCCPPPRPRSCAARRA